MERTGTTQGRIHAPIGDLALHRFERITRMFGGRSLGVLDRFCFAWRRLAPRLGLAVGCVGLLALLR